MVRWTHMTFTGPTGAVMIRPASKPRIRSSRPFIGSEAPGGHRRHVASNSYAQFFRQAPIMPRLLTRPGGTQWSAQQNHGQGGRGWQRLEEKRFRSQCECAEDPCDDRAAQEKYRQVESFRNRRPCTPNQPGGDECVVQACVVDDVG